MTTTDHPWLSGREPVLATADGREREWVPLTPFGRFVAECKGRFRTLVRGNRYGLIQVLAQTTAVVSGGALMSGWSLLVLLVAIPTLLLSVWNARLGLVVGGVLEMLIVRRHGSLAVLVFVAVLLIWSTRRGIFRIVGAAALASAGWLGRAQPAAVGWTLWAASAALLSFEVLRYLTMRRHEGCGEDCRGR